MFSTNAALQTSSTSYKNLRRRQRPLDDRTSSPKAKRHRSSLREKTSDTNLCKAQDETRLYFDKTETWNSVPAGDEFKSPSLTNLNDIPLRGPRKAEIRERLDSSSVLVSEHRPNASRTELVLILAIDRLTMITILFPTYLASQIKLRRSYKVPSHRFNGNHV